MELLYFSLGLDYFVGHYYYFFFFCLLWLNSFECYSYVNVQITYTEQL